MATIEADTVWHSGIDLQALASNWTYYVNAQGEQTLQRQTTSARAIGILLSRLHHLVGHTPRVLFAKIHKFGSRPLALPRQRC
jgi:hypothetical protein